MESLKHPHQERYKTYILREPKREKNEKKNEKLGNESAFVYICSCAWTKIYNYHSGIGIDINSLTVCPEYLLKKKYTVRVYSNGQHGYYTFVSGKMQCLLEGGYHSR